jgi:O-antigen/teichoic acid export membrane protein
MEKTIAARCVVRAVYREAHSAGRAPRMEKTIAAGCVVRAVYRERFGPAMSRSRQFAGGLVLSYGYQAAVILTGLWLTPFYLSRIGQHDYGLWLVGTQLLTYLTLTDFGVVALLPLEIGYAKGRAGGTENASELQKIVGQTLRLVLYQLPIVIAVAIALWMTIPAEWQGLRRPLAVVLIGFVVAFPLRILPDLLRGLQDLTFLGTLQMVNWAVTTVATVLMVAAGWSLLALAVGWLISQVLMAPLFLWRLGTRFPGLLPHELPPLVWSATRVQLEKGFWISVSQVAVMLMGNTDVIIIGKFLGPAAVVPYAITGKLVMVLANQAGILMQTATPGLCELKTGESRERLLRVLVALTHGVLAFCGLVFCVVLLVNHWFVDWWISARQHGEQYGGFALTAVFLTSIVLRQWTTTTAYSVFCFGYQRRISLTNLVDGLVTAASCVVLTLLFGLPGAAAGTILGACFVSLPCNLSVIARDTGETILGLVRKMLAGWLPRFALVAGGVLGVALLWSPKSFWEAAGASTCVTAIYCALMLPTILRSPLGIYLEPLGTSFRARYVALQMRLSS